MMHDFDHLQVKYPDKHPDIQVKKVLDRIEENTTLECKMVFVSPKHKSSMSTGRLTCKTSNISTETRLEYNTIHKKEYR